MPVCGLTILALTLAYAVMFVLGVLMEAGQHFSPGRAVELGDVIANGAGVSCGVLLASPIRTLLAILLCRA
jgi:VanZ family protein